MDLKPGRPLPMYPERAERPTKPHEASTMADERKNPAAGGQAGMTAEPLKSVSPAVPAAKSHDEAYQALRQIGGRAWQLHAATRAADHYIAQDAVADRNTGSWLLACAVDLAEEVAADLDSLARTLKERPSEGAPLHKLRAQAHKLQAATRAADHFLDQDTGEDRTTASWLVACALDLAARLAAQVDDEASLIKRGGGDAAAFSEAVSGRRSAAPPLRSAIA